MHLNWQTKERPRFRRTACLDISLMNLPAPPDPSDSQACSLMTTNAPPLYNTIQPDPPSSCPFLIRFSLPPMAPYPPHHNHLTPILRIADEATINKERTEIYSFPTFS
ncbi:unnamed protein product [Rhizophagus irregularis]|nr:unnamed protein product [Rhizophagus irregularis]